MQTYRHVIRLFLAAFMVGALMLSCSVGETGISGYEEAAIEEQMTLAMSVEEGGVVYSAEALVEPSLYEELEESDPTPDGDTGYRTVSWIIDFPYYDSSTTAVMRYRLKDGDGVVQSGYDSNTRVVEAELAYSRDVAAVRYSAAVDLTTSAVITGLQTSSVTLNGDFHYSRIAEAADGVPFDFFLALSTEAELTDLSFAYNPGSGRYALTGGSSSTELSGTINGRSFSRSANWIFMESYQASLYYEGETLSVNVETGTIGG